MLLTSAPQKTGQSIVVNLAVDCSKGSPDVFMMCLA